MSYADYKRQGYQVLNAYLIASNINLKADVLLSKISRLNPDFVVGNLGNYFDLTLEGDSNKLNKAMQKLAYESGEKIPDLESFKNAMKAEMDSSFIYVVKYAAVESAKEIGQGVENVAAASLSTVKLVYYLIPLGIFAALYIGYKKVKAAAG